MRRHTGKITLELIKSSKLVFHPQTELEATKIQEKLISFGCKWDSDGSTRPDDQDRCVALSLNVDRGRMKISADFSREGAYLCETADLLEEEDSPHFQSRDYKELAARFETLSEKFDALAKKFDALEPKTGQQIELLEKIHAELYPDMPSKSIQRKGDDLRI